MSRMTRLSLVVAVLAVGFVLGTCGQASATSCPANEYCAAEGTTSAPGTFVGTIGTAAGDFNQIGDLSLNNSGSSAYAFVNSSNNPDYYEFYWGGGILDIVGEVGNNGAVPDGIDMELDSYGPNQTGGTEALVSGASIWFPASPDFTPQTLYDAYLGVGYYSIDTSDAVTDSSNGDPNYQITFTDPAPTPEPSSLGMLGIGLLALFGLVAVSKRRMAGIGTVA